MAVRGAGEELIAYGDGFGSDCWEALEACLPVVQRVLFVLEEMPKRALRFENLDERSLPVQTRIK